METIKVLILVLMENTLRDTEKDEWRCFKKS